MASEKTLLYYGALLHDVGRVVYRASNSSVSYPELGAKLLLDRVAARNDAFASEDGRRIAEQIRCCGARGAELAPDSGNGSLAYIVGFAEGVVAPALRDGASDESPEHRDFRLRKIFNTLNDRQGDGCIEHEDYGTIRETLVEGLSRIGVSPKEVQSVLNLLESCLSEVPASTSADGLVDVSLFDRAKTTAGIAACVYEYLRERGIADYKQALFNSNTANEEDMFLLYSCDMSGIQDFIYNISGAGALKQLRARSMYLELLLEHVVDELLERLALNRSNLLYTGGGHAYLLLPNTSVTKAVLHDFSQELTQWFVERYRTDLYVASAWVECCADDLANRGENKRRYPMLYARLSRALSNKKAMRYDAQTLRELNFGKEPAFDHSRECTECHRSDLGIDADGKCPLCAALGLVSASLARKDVFLVEQAPSGTSQGVSALALPFGCQLRMITADEHRARRGPVHRVYAKQGASIDASATRIHMGDYEANTHGEGLVAYATQSATLEQGRGIKRLGVLRADVDDLGATFAFGLPNERTNICRTSALSRALSTFFKSTINEVLERANLQVQIIYSGGDDLFIIGNWSDVIQAAMSIREAFGTYVGNGSVTLSGGIGMFGATYPIARMASETEELEDAAKAFHTGASSKNAIALWSDQNVFGWDEFVGVVEPRMREIARMLANAKKGNAFVYRLLDQLRNYDDVASAPRLAYLLARAFEDEGQRDGDAARRVYAWAQDEGERRRLVVALEWYVYSVREGSDV